MGDRFDCDCAIVGAGCAGLSLAVHLIERGPPELRVVLLEPRTEYQRDRTWCFWNATSHPFAGCVTHRWSRWRVRTGTQTHVAGSSRYAYQQLPADAFYREALARIGESGRVQLRTGVRVDSVGDQGDHVRIDSSAGALRARVAFDSRPRRLDGPAPKAEVRLMQHFRGWSVHTDRPVFDPETCTLMDFDVDQRDGIHFVYVLPTDDRTALVEDTWLSEAPFTRERYERELERYLSARLGVASYEVTATEQGVLPMTTEAFPLADGPRVMRIGLAGGLGKPSTGYAFLFIQRHSREIARRMWSSNPPPVVAPRGAWARTLDRIFLQVLRERPAEAPELFLRLFRDAPDDVVVRFLSETSSVADDLRVMRSLPTGPFAGAAWRAKRLWLRSR